jgi:hypothetical protein
MIAEIELFPPKLEEEQTKNKEKRKYHKQKPTTDVKSIDVVKGTIYVEFP